MKTNSDPLLWEDLGKRTWMQLRECTYLAMIALAQVERSVERNEDAKAALQAMACVLGPDWDGVHVDKP